MLLSDDTEELTSAASGKISVAHKHYNCAQRPAVTNCIAGYLHADPRGCMESHGRTTIPPAANA